MMRALLWKEWRESSWKLLFGTVLLVGVTAISLSSRMFQDQITMMLTLIIGIAFLPLLVTMGIVGTEREKKTLGFLVALPIGSCRVLLIKTIVAMLVGIIPLLAAMLIYLAMAGQREMPAGTLLHYYSAGMWAACSLIIWTLAFSTAQPNEGRIAAVGLGVLLFWGLHLMLAKLLSDWRISNWSGAKTAGAFLECFHPLYAFTFPDVTADRTEQVIKVVAALVFQTTTLYLLWRWAAGRLAGQKEVHR